MEPVEPVAPVERVDVAEPVAATGAADEATAVPMKRHLTVKQIVSFVFGLVIVVGIFVFAIPRFADYGEVSAALKTLTPVEFWSLFGVMIFNLFTYWWANMAALPGLSLKKAAVLTQTGTSVANTMPAGGAIAIGVTYAQLASWGFTGGETALYVGVTGIWNIFTKLALPVVALAVLVVTGHSNAALAGAAAIGVVVLASAVALLALVFRSEPMALRVGELIGRAASAVLRLIRRRPVVGMGDRAVKFRRETIILVRRRWLRLTWTTLLSHLALFVVLLLSLRHMGVGEPELPAAEVFAVFAFSRLLSSIPITPGGVGVIDLGYIGGLVAADPLPGAEAQIVAAVLIFRVLTYGIQIPLGAVTYFIWRGKAEWRRATPPPGSIAAEIAEQTARAAAT
jgi:putative heme transporter